MAETLEAMEPWMRSFRGSVAEDTETFNERPPRSGLFHWNRGRNPRV